MLTSAHTLCSETVKSLYYGSGLGIDCNKPTSPSPSPSPSPVTPQSTTPDDLAQVSSDSEDDDNDGIPAITHTVIFKCIGAHKEDEYQEHLALAKKKALWWKPCSCKTESRA